MEIPPLKNLSAWCIVTPVQDQGSDHPHCWVFAACGAYESKYQIANGHGSFKLYKQSILNCSEGIVNPSSGEGAAYKVLEWLAKINTDKLSTDCNYKGEKATCTEDDILYDILRCSPSGTNFGVGPGSCFLKQNHYIYWQGIKQTAYHLHQS